MLSIFLLFHGTHQEVYIFHAFWDFRPSRGTEMAASQPTWPGKPKKVGKLEGYLLFLGHWILAFAPPRQNQETRCVFDMSSPKVLNRVGISLLLKFQGAQVSSASWVVLGCPGSSWVILDGSGAFWVVLGGSWTFWVALGRSGSS